MPLFRALAKNMATENIHTESYLSEKSVKNYKV